MICDTAMYEINSHMTQPSNSKYINRILLLCKNSIILPAFCYITTIQLCHFNGILLHYQNFMILYHQNSTISQNSIMLPDFCYIT